MPETMRARSPLRLKNGSARDDAGPDGQVTEQARCPRELLLQNIRRTKRIGDESNLGR